MALTLKAMEYFTTALRHGNIAKAAAELNIAASAVSAAIDQVEAEFGLTLATRQRARGILNMRPLTSQSYAGASVVEKPISDPLPPLTLAVGYDKSRPRRVVQSFVQACQAYFAEPGSARCIVE